VIQAGMVTHTSITDLLALPIVHFWYVFRAIANVIKKPEDA